MFSRCCCVDVMATYYLSKIGVGYTEIRKGAYCAFQEDNLAKEYAEYLNTNIGDVHFPSNWRLNGVTAVATYAMTRRK